jgi:hypothetical protein
MGAHPRPLLAEAMMPNKKAKDRAANYANPSAVPERPRLKLDGAAMPMLAAWLVRLVTSTMLDWLIDDIHWVPRFRAATGSRLLHAGCRQDWLDGLT